MVDNFNSESVIDAHLHLCDIPQVEKEIEFFFSKYDKIRRGIIKPDIKVTNSKTSVDNVFNFSALRRKSR